MSCVIYRAAIRSCMIYQDIAYQFVLTIGCVMYASDKRGYLVTSQAMHIMTVFVQYHPLL